MIITKEIELSKLLHCCLMCCKICIPTISVHNILSLKYQSGYTSKRWWNWISSKTLIVCLLVFLILLLRCRCLLETWWFIIDSAANSFRNTQELRTIGTAGSIQLKRAFTPVFALIQTFNFICYAGVSIQPAANICKIMSTWLSCWLCGFKTPLYLVFMLTVKISL